MYKLVICDDEKTIREGLCAIVNWKALGFDIVASFDNGADALLFAKSNHVDALLTDIHMYDVSGLMLIERMQKIHPNLKSVILTGYKEFSYAQTAISLGVSAFLVKPIDFNQLNTVFSDLNKELEQIANTKAIWREKEQEQKETLPLLRRQFFAELLGGVFTNIDEVEKRVKLCGLPSGFSYEKCLLFQVQLLDLELFLQEKWQYGKDWLKVTIERIFEVEEKTEWQTCIVYSQSMKDVQILFANLNSKNENDVISFLEQKLITIEKLIGLKAFSLQKNIYLCLKDFLLSKHEARINMEKHNELTTSENYEYMKNLLCNSLHENDVEMLNVVTERLFSTNRNQDVTTMTAQKLVRFALEEFEQFKIDLSKNGTILRLFYDMSTQLDLNETKKIFLTLCKNMALKIGEIEFEGNQQMIFVAQEYIKENYKQDLTLDEVSSKVFLSSAYFSALFRKKIGSTYSEYLTSIRMENAKKLLEKHSSRVVDVCGEVGYNNVKYFTTCFKKFVGMTPSEYRQQFAGEKL